MITKKQALLLEAIKGFKRDCGHYPSIRELASLHKKTIGTIQGHLDALEAAGYIKRKKFKPMSISLTVLDKA